MKITIDIESATTGVRVTSQASGPEESVIPATREFANQGAALSAGVSMAIGSGERAALLPPHNASTESSGSANVITTAAHPYGFAPASGVGMGAVGLSAGGARG